MVLAAWQMAAHPLQSSAMSTSLHALPRVLLTGFDPFNGASVNPSWQAVRALHGKRVMGRRLVAAQLPTEFGAVLNRLDALLARWQPELVVCVGQAGGRAALSLERVAINLIDAPIADNAGDQPVDRPVVPGGPAAYFSTLPVKAGCAALRRAGLPAEVSHTAGTFVCNQVFYGLMHRLATQPALSRVRGGFVHVPWLPEQGSPAMPLTDVVQGLKEIVRLSLDGQAEDATNFAESGRMH
jgi:pyroglutamyl-peptidase